MDTLIYLFGGEEKVNLLRLFIFNPQTPFDISTISRKTDIKQTKLKKELRSLEKIGFLNRKSFYMDIVKKKAGKEVESSEKFNGWILNNSFVYTKNIEDIFLRSNSFTHPEVVKRFSKTGKIKLLIVSGVFINDPDSRVDLLIVGDKLSSSMIDHGVKFFESRIGKEIRYSAFETVDFKYRLGLYDKLIRDILDFSHKKLINKLGLE